MIDYYDDDTAPSLFGIPSGSHSLTGRDSLLVSLQKARSPSGGSLQGEVEGQKQHLFDYEAISELRDQNPYHAACVSAKVQATVGLGHRASKIAEILDPLCEISWLETLVSVVSDSIEFGNGYVEVVRDVDGGQVVGLHHVPAKDIWVVVEDRNTWHYVLASKTGLGPAPHLSGLRFARFGDRDDLIRRQGIGEENRRRVSEVIHVVTTPTGRRSPFYAEPEWISATPAIELHQCVTQQAFDFFFNGCSPAMLFEVAGKRLDPDDWGALQKQLKRHQGIGNRHKLMALNLSDPDLRLTIHKLQVDSKDSIADTRLIENAAQQVVTAHRVPLVLANIQIPGKLGAANEQVAAIRSFQVNVVEQMQVLVSSILANTLGRRGIGVLGLNPADFKGDDGNGFVRLTDRLDLDRAEVESRMHMTTDEAARRGRDLSAGLAERGEDIPAGRGRDPLAPVDN